MRKSFTMLVVVLCLGTSAASARAQTPSIGSQSLLPVPSAWGQPAQAQQPSTSNVYWQTSTSRSAGYVDDAPAAPSTPGPYTSCFDDAVHGSCCDECCNSCCCCPCDPVWFGALGGIVMTRDKPNERQMTVNFNDLETSLINVRDTVPGQWNGGFEVGFGRTIGEGAVLGCTFWMLDPFHSYANAVSPLNELNTSINLNFVDLGGMPVDHFFDAAHEHRLWRRDDFYNLELNLVTLPYTLGGVFSVNWLAGVRWFRFSENLLFGSVSGGNEFGSDGGINEAYLDWDVTNNLVGFQIGGFANWLVIGNLNLYAGAKAGLYGNSIDHRSSLVRGDGLVGFDYISHETDVSMLGELNIGLDYQFTRWLTGYLGYRAVFISGIALSDNQIPQYLADAPGIRDIEGNGELILHGAMAGCQFAY